MNRIFLITLLSIGFLFSENYSIEFSNGEYGRIQMTESLSSFENFTIEFWYFETNGGNETIFGNENANSTNGSIQIKRYGNSFDIYVSDGVSVISNSNVSSIVQNEWMHLALCYDGSILKFFINGILEYSDTGVLGIINPIEDDFVINRHSWSSGSSSNLSGLLDELRVSSNVRYNSDFNVSTQEFSIDEHTLGLWHFNEGDGTQFLDESGNENYGSLESGASWSINTPDLTENTTTPSNTHSLSFDGVDDFVDFADIYNSLELPVTFQIQTKFNSSGGDIFVTDSDLNESQDNYFGFYLGVFSNQISIMYGDGNGTGGGHRRTGRTYVSLNPNTWYSITCIIRGPQDMSIYLDGVNQEMNYDDGGFGGSVGSNEYPFTLGGTNVGNNSSSYYDGKIDELRFWNIELTDPDIISFESFPEEEPQEGLIGYWSFNEGEGNTVNDYSGLGYHGTIYGATWSTDVPFEGSVTTEEISAVVSVGNGNAYVIQYMYTDTVLVPVLIDSLSDGISAGEFRFTGFQDGLEFLEVITDSSLLGVADWTIVSNDQDTLLITVGYGSTNIDTSGILFFLKTAVSDTMTEGIASIEIVEIELNESSDEITVHDGGINIFNPMLGDVSENDDISAFDASLILKYLVETEELVYPQMLSADVTYDGEVTALDASVIAQFVAELIDTLPYTDVTQLAGMGDFGIDDGEFTPGEVLQVPIQLYNGSNLLSFELEMNFDSEILTYSEIEFSEMNDHFLVEENQLNGTIKLAGAGATPDGQEGVFATVSFIVGNDIENEIIEIGINNYRTNENEMQPGSVATFTNSSLAVNQNFIPANYTLHQNYPNPFNPVTKIKYDLPEQTHVSIMIYDILGKRVKHLVNEMQSSGYKSCVWDATNNSGDPVSAGMYFYTIDANDYSKTMKMVLLK